MIYKLFSSLGQHEETQKNVLKDFRYLDIAIFVGTFPPIM